MTGQEILDYAKSSRLNQLAVKEDPDKFMLFLNLGLKDLYERFLLSTKEYTITTVAGTFLYPVPEGFIKPESLVLVSDTDDNGEDIYINDASKKFSVFTPDAFNLKIPFAADGISVVCTYYTTPDRVASIDDTVLVPPQMLNALLLYIAYEAHTATSGGSSPESQAQYQLYEAECRKLRSSGLVQDSFNDDSKFSERGFV